MADNYDLELPHHRAFRWTAETGMQSVEDWLRAGAGVSARQGFGSACLMVNATTEGEAASAWVRGTYQVRF